MIFQGACLGAHLGQDGIVEICFDRAGSPVNKLDRLSIAELGAATVAIRATEGARGVLMTSRKEAFIVGADIFEFSALFAQSELQIEADIAQRNSVFTAFEDLNLPTCAVINGLALGGGLEVALTCDGRVMADNAKVGLPEVSLGLFPGFGGTVRLPRVAGVAVAIDWITSGKPQTAQAAAATSLIDRITTPETARTQGLALLESLLANGEWRRRRAQRRAPLATEGAWFAEARQRLGKTSQHQPAALAAVDLMERAAGLSRDAALELEHRAFAGIARTQAAASLVQLFINDQGLKKKSREYERIAGKVRRAAVVGAGIMGGGIAYTSAVKGIPVLMQDIRQEALDVGLAEARKLLAKQVDSGRLTQSAAAQVGTSIQPTLGPTDLGTVDLVVEAVVENLNVKQTVLADLEKRARPDTILASNTSSLSISQMAGALQRPENFVGMHFFNPVPLMPLVEVVRGEKTSDRAAATTAAYAHALGKTPIVVKECPGFLVNRILTPYFLGCLQAIHAGADYREIDRVMEEFGWPMGPAYLQDVVGMDTLLHVLDTISAGFAPRMQLDFPHAVRLFVDRGRLGQKSGVGFYRYETDPKGRPRKSVDPDTVALLASVQPNGPRNFTAAELRERLMLPMIIEAIRCLEEGIVGSAAEVDLSLILGLGFPRYTGGPLQYADWLGMNHLLARADQFASLGPLYAATEGMRQSARTGRTFY